MDLRGDGASLDEDVPDHGRDRSGTRLVVKDMQLFANEEM
jgi:hypothetical protein